MKNNRLSLVLPAYNEKENIKPLIDAIVGTLQDVHEIIVVDDDSPDGTGKIVSAMIRSGGYKFLKLEQKLHDRGLTKSISRGIELATGDVVGWMDCDFSMPPEHLPLLLSYINRDYDIAVGSRFVSGGKGQMLSRMLNLFIQTCLGRGFNDYTSGFVVARRDVFNRIRLRGDYGEYFMDFIYRAIRLNYRVKEIPYVWRPRRAGDSKTGNRLGDFFKKGWKYIVTAMRLVMLKGFED